MSQDTSISWCDSTFNPWIGCTKVGPGCDRCYAATHMDTRLHVVSWGAGAPRKLTSMANWRQPGKWNAEPFYECDCGYRGSQQQMTTNAVHACGLKFRRVRRRVFCASLADVFDNEVNPQWRERLWLMIDSTPNLDWLLLTKRIGNVSKMLSEWTGKMPANVWLGATVVNQEEADRDIPKLLETPARVHFLSMEPLLGPVNLDPLWLRPSPSSAFLSGNVNSSMPTWTRIGCIGLDWIIVGGESGNGARPMHPHWVRSLRDQCAAAGVPFHFKQWGEFAPADSCESEFYTLPFVSDKTDASNDQVIDMRGNVDCTNWRGSDQQEPFALMRRVGKKNAGRLLEGRQHNEFPK